MIVLVQRIDKATYFTLSEMEFRELHNHPTGGDSTAEAHPWIRVNFISSIDGAVSVDGKSGGLGTPADRQIFTTLRESADAILVGAGTVRAENYGGTSASAELRERRVAAGLTEIAPVVVVTASANLDLTLRLFTDTTVAPVVICAQSAPEDRRAAIASTGADLAVVPGSSVSTQDIRAALTERGLHRILCEGGPSLFGQLLADDAVDDAFITTSPHLVAGRAPRIAWSDGEYTRRMRIGHVLSDTDGTLAVRWIRDRPGTL